MTPRQIVLTGATGFTGPFVLQALRRRFPHAAIRCLVRPTSRLDGLRGMNADAVIGDLRDSSSLRAAFAGADTLVNVASLGFDWNDSLFSALRASSIERGVFLSTTAILTKLPVKSRPIRERGEAMVRDSGLNWTIIRPTMIYGTPSDRNISRLIRFVLRWPIVPLLARHAIQQPVHVADVADAVVASIGAPVAGGRAYNVAGRDPMRLEDLVRVVIRIAGVRRLVVPVPAATARAAVTLYGRISNRPAISLEQFARLHEDKGFDYSEAARDLAYDPRSFDTGVRGEVAMMRAGRSA